MRRFFILSILCFVGVHSASDQQQNAQPIAKLIITECVKEFDTDVKKIGNVRNKADATCLFACGIRKWSDTRGLTLHKGLTEMIDEVYKKGFQSSKFTRADVVAKVDRCSTKESNECEFTKCVQIFNPPFADVYLYFIKNYKTM